MASNGIRKDETWGHVLLKGLVSKPENNGKRATIVRCRPSMFSVKRDVFKTFHALYVHASMCFIGLVCYPVYSQRNVAKTTLNGAFTFDSQGYLDDQQKYQASSLVWFLKAISNNHWSWNFRWHVQVSLEGRFVKLKPENVEVHLHENTSNFEATFDKQRGYTSICYL